MKTAKTNQAGFASLVVGLIVILVLALMTVGFSQLVRREQTNTLNKQLSTQAYYAAESGINDAMRDMAAGHVTGPKTSCADDNADGYTSVKDSPILDSANGVGYTCVLVSLSPQDLNYTNLSNSQWMATQVSSVSSIDTISVAWKNVSGGNCFQKTFNQNTAGNFRTGGSWPSASTICNGGSSATDVVEFSITPLDSTGYSRSGLVNGAFQTFFFPNDPSNNFTTTQTASATAYTAGGTSSAPMISGNCGLQGSAFSSTDSSTIYCKAKISGLSGSHFLLAMKTVYASNTSIVISSSLGATPVGFSGTQAVIDSTGKAQNVLRRIQVRVPISASASSVNLPDALSGGDGICKRMQSNPNGTTFYSVSGAQAGATDTCNGAE